jgi:diguanylate cyclase (GGDEF)-like protein/PAS domain S-box-containing protein
VNRFSPPHPFVVIALYSIGIGVASYGMVHYGLPAALLMLFVVLIILVAFYYPRLVVFTLIAITLPLGVYGVAPQAVGGYRAAIPSVFIVLFCTVLIAELVQKVNHRQGQIEEPYLSLLDNMNDVTFVVDKQARFTYISPAIERISGYKLNQILGHHFSEFVHPEDLQVLEKSVQQSFKGQGEINRFRVIDADGSQKHVRTFSRPIVEDGKLAGLMGILVDISEFINVQEDLQIRQRNQMLLNEITRAALAEPDFRMMLQELASRLSELFNANGCIISLWEADSQSIVPSVASSSKRAALHQVELLPGEETIAQAVLEAATPLFAEDVHTSPYLSSRLAQTFPAKSVLGLPLIAEGRWLGAALILYDQVHRFKLVEIEWAEVVAAQVSLAAYKGQTLQAEREERQIAESLREAGITLGETLEYEEILDRLLPQIQKIVPFDCAALFLVSRQEVSVARLVGYDKFYPPEVEQFVSQVVFEIDSTPNLKQLFDTQQPLIIPDVRLVPDWVQIEGIDLIRSWAGVPIIANGEVLAIYSLEKHELNYFRSRHIWILTAFAAQASLALQNASLYARARRQMHESETLRQASLAVLSELDLEKVLSQILEQLERVIPYDSASVFLAERDHLRILAGRGFENEAEVIGLEVERGNPLFEEIIRTRLPLILPDAREDPRFGQFGGTSYVRGWMGVPLIAQGEIIGQLTIDSRQPDVYTLQDAELVLDFATETSIAIQHATLYERALDTANRLAILQQASQEISATLDPQHLYEIIYKAAASIMPAEAFVISMMDETQQEIEAVYMVDRQGQTPAQRFPLGTGLSGYIIRTGKSVLINDFDNGFEFDIQHFGDPAQIEAFLAVPMRRQDSSLFGMVSVQSYRKNAYTQQDLEMLELLAAQAAGALDNTRLFAELQRQAIMDELTGLYNRRHFFEVARLEFERSRRYRRTLGIIMLDIDHFKEVNDQYGHLVGDQVLRVVAERCRQNVRSIDLVGRYGGEEFVLLVPETDAEGVRQLAERLRVAVSDTPIYAREIMVRITASIGVASSSADCPDLDHLISQADQALFPAKYTGCNIVGLDAVQDQS